MKEESEKVGLKLNIQKTKITASGPITSWEIDGETVETVSDFIFWAPKSLKMVTAAMKLKDAYSLEGKLWPPRQHIKKQRHYFANQGLSSQSYDFSRDGSPPGSSVPGIFQARTLEWGAIAFSYDQPR